MPEEKGLHITVTGRVQGVGYRYYCRNAAGSMGLKGYVMNMPDGNVEIEVFGGRDKIKDFISEITGRDRGFVVDEITTEEIPVDESYRDFGIKFHPY